MPRRLDPDEAALWGRVAGTVTRPGDPRPSQRAAPLLPLRRADPPPGPARTPGTTLDAGWDRRLAAGRVEPDRILDLHGLTLDAAHRAVERALADAVARGQRLLVIVAGRMRGGPADRVEPRGRGIIRASLGDWLHASDHAARIAAVRPAHLRHGGHGAVYVVLRRPRGRP